MSQQYFSVAFTAVAKTQQWMFKLLDFLTGKRGWWCGSSWLVQESVRHIFCQKLDFSQFSELENKVKGLFKTYIRPKLFCIYSSLWERFFFSYCRVICSFVLKLSVLNCFAFIALYKEGSASLIAEWFVVLF